ncbi:unnamed protein product [Ranitomeya imitator]|uniref:PiggyBac transposable element-derived protein domain-containing protein n=1 Tax=Ranitomeya imitator TaxID=111125 RepID=A0ABN9LBT9_9NEOB|nr:unnamed protein product [Ranitomeya imitator]
MANSVKGFKRGLDVFLEQNNIDGNQGKHRVTKRGPALSYPMFTLSILSHKQISKRARFGIKFYKMCKSSTGHTSAFRIYEGKDSQLNPPGCPIYLGTSGKIVWELITPLLQKGYNLYVDNYYTSIPLFKISKKFRKGQSETLHKGEMLAHKNKEKDIFILSLIHTDSTRAIADQQGSTTPKHVSVVV